ncbi:biotin transporter BioY [Salinicola halophilus]|uniref:biotin transporter BioY n=1 Tax=Salinicola halophilus TaxID=184065 RepID=UPI000DA25490|nr:biotin transporter BioY [Salinicola halophilus]
MAMLSSLAMPHAQGLTSRSRTWQLGAIVAGTLALTLSSYAQIPMVPVPVTLQMLAVTLIGALYGWRLGALTVMAWLGEAAVGLPVLAGGASGWSAFMSPSAGYLLAFPLCAALCGWLAERGWDGHRPWFAGISLLAANLLCLLIGTAWLMPLVGIESAIAVGTVPFLVGALLKSALGAVTLRLLAQTQARGRR